MAMEETVLVLLSNNCPTHTKRSLNFHLIMHCIFLYRLLLKCSIVLIISNALWLKHAYSDFFISFSHLYILHQIEDMGKIDTILNLVPKGYEIVQLIGENAITTLGHEKQKVEK